MPTLFPKCVKPIVFVLLVILIMVRGSFKWGFSTTASRRTKKHYIFTILRIGLKSYSKFGKNTNNVLYCVITK